MAARRAGAGVLAAVLSAGLGAGPAAGPATAEEGLLLSAPQVSPDRELSVVATVPDGMSGEPLPAGAFSASQGGTGVPLFAERVLGRPAELLLVLDAGVDAAALAAEQSAAVDLLRALPPELPTTVLPAGPGGPAPTGTARTALATVAALRPRPGLLLDGAPPAAERRRLVVVMAGCDALRAESRRPAGGDVQVSVLATGSCREPAERLAGDSAGLVRTGLDATTLLAGSDGVTRRLLGQYALRTAPGLADGPVQVTVRSGAAVRSASVPLPARAASSGRPRRGAALVAAALAALAAVGVLADLSRRRRRRWA